MHSHQVIHFIIFSISWLVGFTKLIIKNHRGDDSSCKRKHAFINICVCMYVVSEGHDKIFKEKQKW